MRPKRKTNFFKYASRRKVFRIWALLAFLALIFFLREQYGLRSVDDYNDLAIHLLANIFKLLPVFLVVFGVFIYWQRKKNIKNAATEDSFKEKPWLFNNKIVTISGTVEVVFKTSLGQRLRYAAVDLYRKLTKSNDPIGRFAHLRFLLKSPDLVKGELLMVAHNLKLDKIVVRKGQEVEVSGEYLHRQTFKKSLLGMKKNYYGTLHYTHPPKGYLKIKS